MRDSYVAVDIGASSGRLILGSLENRKIAIKEIHRFSNYSFTEDNSNKWNSKKLLNEILKGLEKAKQLGINSCSLGIDTWAVDYCLLDSNNQEIKEIVSYRDNRTDGAIDKFSRLITKEKIYNKTGIQFLPFNTLFQLYTENPAILEKAETVLLVPDYLIYKLTGKKILERTNASTTQLLNVHTNELDSELLATISLSREQFPEIVEPGIAIGKLRNEWFKEYDLPEVEIRTVGSHDTASAVIGTPGFGDSWAYLSSGTWSLIGTEEEQPIINELSFLNNYTNETGANNKYRFLKNIMGMWLVQEVSKQLNYIYSYEELAKLAEKEKPFQHIIDVNDQRFLNPENIIEEIKSYCEETNQSIPTTVGKIIRAIYDSLALSYKKEITALQQITAKNIEELIIVGGGGNIDLLNQSIANLAKITVKIGPSEATALGNIAIQMLSNNDIRDINEAREIIRNTYPMKVFKPQKNYGGK